MNFNSHFINYLKVSVFIWFIDVFLLFEPIV